MTQEDTRTSPVRETVELGPRWPTIDPFLFCAHHDDDYPAGNDHYAPAVSIDDRELGMDFSGQDGWSMYHGLDVPGFPQHPHRGFETVTFVRTASSGCLSIRTFSRSSSRISCRTAC